MKELFESYAHLPVLRKHTQYLYYAVKQLAGAIKKINPAKKYLHTFCVPVGAIHLAYRGHGG